jgi:hypothetical protein
MGGHYPSERVSGKLWSQGVNHMTDTAPASHPSCSANAGCGHECCPCEGRLKKLEKTVSRIRFWLFVSLGFLILLIGIGIGKGQGHDERGGPREREEVRRIEVQGMPMGGMGGMGGGMRGGPDRGPEMRPEGRPGKGSSPKMRGGKKAKGGDDDDDED